MEELPSRNRQSLHPELTTPVVLNPIDLVEALRVLRKKESIDRERDSYVLHHQDQGSDIIGPQQ